MLHLFHQKSLKKQILKTLTTNFQQNYVILCHFFVK